MHCVELVTGSQHTGFLRVTERSLSLDLFSYDKHFFVPIHNTIAVRTETNHIVSFIGNVGVEVAGRRSWLGQPKMTTFHQEIFSNIAIVGRTAWEDGKQVRRATFSIDGCEQVLNHRVKKKEAAKSQIADGQQHTLFRADIEGGSIRIDYNPHYSFDLDGTVRVEIYFDIEFHTAITVRECLSRLFYFARFFSLSTGLELRPSDIRVYPASRAEIAAVAQSDTPIQDFAVHYPWWGASAEREPVRSYGCVFISADDVELEVTKRALVEWQRREASWQNAVELMATAISLQGEISQHRLVTASRWLEAIPSAPAAQAIPDPDIEKIVLAATNVAGELGYGSLESRIEGAIRRIRQESNAAFFTRLVGQMCARYGNGVLGTESVKDLSRAWRLRGVAAHGQRAGIDNVQEFQKALHALEALCLLLTASELPLSDSARRRIGEHNLVRGHLLARNF